MALTSSYFVGDYSIPNLIGSQPINTANKAVIDRIILIKEKYYLQKLMGITMYDDFIANPENYSELVAKLYDTQNYISPVTGYCFYWWKRQTTTYETGGGNVEPKHENATVYGTGIKAATAYNDSIRSGIELIKWILEVDDRYADFAPDYDFWKVIPIGL